MSTLAMHIDLLGSQGMDPIVFMRMLRFVFFGLAGFLLLFEPMACGGKNLVFHRLLSGMMFAGAWVTYEQAISRMTVIAKDPIAFYLTIPPGTMFWSELTSTVFVLLVAARLLYDSYVFHRLSRLGVSGECGRRHCPKGMTPALTEHRRKGDS